MRALVTGGAGFIGHHLVRALVDEGHGVTVIDDLSTGQATRLAPFGDDVRLVEASILDAEALERAMHSSDTVFHLAAMPSVARSFAQPAACDEVNVIGTIRVAETAHRLGVRRIVLASSAAVYGTPVSLPCREDATPAPHSPYGASKLAAEHYLHVVGEHLGVATTAVRFFNVYGPWQDPTSGYAAVVPAWITTLLRGERPIINGDGGITRDFIYVGDAVAAAIAAADPAAPDRLTCNVASGRSISLLELLDAISRAIGGRPDPIIGPARPGDIEHSVADVDLARRALRFEASLPFDEGIARTVAWYRANPSD